VYDTQAKRQYYLVSFVQPLSPEFQQWQGNPALGGAGGQVCEKKEVEKIERKKRGKRRCKRKEKIKI